MITIKDVKWDDSRMPWPIGYLQVELPAKSTLADPIMPDHGKHVEPKPTDNSGDR